MIYDNDVELHGKGKYLGTITADFVKASDTLKEASYQMRVREISQYPIFPIAKDEIQWASLLLGKSEADNDWNYYFSMVEEFTGRELIGTDHLADFYASYKSPDEYCCLFVIDQDFVNFVYIPYPTD